MNIFIVALLVFVSSILITESLLYGYRTWRYPDRNKVRERLKALTVFRTGNKSESLLRRRILSEVPLLDSTLNRLPLARRLDQILQTANMRYPLGFFVLITLVFASVTYVAVSAWKPGYLISICAAVLAGSLPSLYVLWKRNQRTKKLERQLPDALELIARGLRAGHALSSALKFAADEFDDPLGTEFGETLDEINFGISVADALRNLADRVHSPDIKYFVVSIIIQKDVGGNLAEIMDQIAHVIRERFKLRGKIRTLSAEGKLTAVILLALPFLVILALRFTNPDYIKLLWEESSGKIISVISASMMAVGIFVIRKMIKIKV
jgi:tight adherence protein B